MSRIKKERRELALWCMHIGIFMVNVYWMVELHEQKDRASAALHQQARVIVVESTPVDTHQAEQPKARLLIMEDAPTPTAQK